MFNMKAKKNWTGASTNNSLPTHGRNPHTAENKANERYKPLCTAAVRLCFMAFRNLRALIPADEVVASIVFTFSLSFGAISGMTAVVGTVARD
jgi:hypothetical protein